MRFFHGRFNVAAAAVCLALSASAAVFAADKATPAPPATIEHNSPAGKKKFIMVPGPIVKAPPHAPQPPEPPKCKCESQIIGARQQLDENIRRFGADSLPVASSQENLGMLYILARKFDLAESCLNTALAIKRKCSDLADTAETYTHIAMLYEFEKQPQKAKEARDQAASLFDRFIGERKGKTPVPVLIDRGQLYLASMDMKDARKCYADALQVARSTYGQKSVAAADVMEATVVLYSGPEDYEKGLKYLRDSLAMRRALKAPFGAQTFSTVLQQAYVLLKHKQAGDAVELLKQAMSDQKFNLTDVQLQSCKSFAAELKKTGNARAAASLLRQTQQCKVHQAARLH